jgi:hypothetical protein
MSFLMTVAAAIYAAGGGGGGGGLDAITANWSDIAVDSDDPTGVNSPVTISFSSGGTRTLQLSGSFTYKGTLQYILNLGSGIVITPGGTIDVVDADELYFTYTGVGREDHGATVTVTDITRSSLVDTFGVDYTFTGN